MNPPDLRYAPTHEWAKLDGDVVTVGITEFAVEQLTEPTFLELPKVGTGRRRRQAVRHHRVGEVHVRHLLRRSRAWSSSGTSR